MTSLQVQDTREKKSEGKSYGEMELEVAAEAGMQDGIMLVGVAVGGIDGLHTHVETQDEVVEVEAQAQTVGHGQLLVELVEAELSAGLFGIVA